MFTRIAVLTGLLAVLACALTSYSNQGILYHLLRQDLDSAAQLQAVKDYFFSWGGVAPLMYVLIVPLEVVIAPVPGLMLYAPGGIIFGGFWGGLLSLLGNVLGAGIACGSMRLLGGGLVESYIERSALKHYDERLSNSGIWVIFLLRVNPLTSSDLVSYAAGLTRMSIWKVMLGTLLGMAPLCWIQAYFADQLLQAFPGLIYPLIIASIIYVAIVLWILRNLFTRKTPSP
jgi:uncharacterized membrane protein YdjX (TVP38/TMEM64 family)